MSSGGSHPYISYVIETLKESGFNVKSFNGFSALIDLRILLASVEPKVKLTEIWKKTQALIVETYDARNKIIVDYRDNSQAQANVERFDFDNVVKYINILEGVWVVMWDNKYLLDTTYDMFDPSLGRNSP